MIPATPRHPENVCKHYREDTVSFFFTHVSKNKKLKDISSAWPVFMHVSPYTDTHDQLLME